MKGSHGIKKLYGGAGRGYGGGGRICLISNIPLSVWSIQSISPIFPSYSKEFYN